MVKLPTLQLLILDAKGRKAQQVEENNPGTRIMRTVMELGDFWIIPALISKCLIERESQREEGGGGESKLEQIYRY